MFLSNTRSSYCKKLLNNAKQIIYSIVLICGVGLIALSFYAKDNWVNVCSGVGTGLLTSLVVSAIINAENNAHEKRKKDKEKMIGFIMTRFTAKAMNTFRNK